MNLSTPLLSALLGSTLVFASCTSSPDEITMQDAQGNYITTSDFHSMARYEFFDAMEAGLRDFDNQVAELRSRANSLGGEALGEFADCEDELMEKRTDFESQMVIAQNALDEDWADERSETVEAYVDLREALSEAYEEVLDQ